MSKHVKRQRNVASGNKCREEINETDYLVASRIESQESVLNSFDFKSKELGNEL